MKLDLLALFLVNADAALRLAHNSGSEVKRPTTLRPNRRPTLTPLRLRPLLPPACLTHSVFSLQPAYVDQSGARADQFVMGDMLRLSTLNRHMGGTIQYTGYIQEGQILILNELN